MDAAEFFKDVVKPNYEEFRCDQNQIQRLWNAVVSLNTVPEYVALDRLDYREQAGPREFREKAKEIRNGYPILLVLKVCAETLKHVRKLEGTVRTEFTSTPSSTGILSNQPTTWVIGYKAEQYMLSDVLHRAFNTLSTFPELQ
jgi:hypothetical protein